jgi:hypothetical protein
VSTITTKIYALADMTTVLATLTSPMGEQWSDVMNDVGSGQFQLQADDPQLSDCALGNVAQFNVDGSPAFSFVIDRRVRASISKPGEEDEGHTVILSGEGIGQILNRWRVTPDLGFEKNPWARTRTFSFASPEFTPDGSWIVPTVIVPQQYATSAHYTGLPDGFWCPAEPWIGPSSGDDDAAPFGYWYAIYYFTLPDDFIVTFGMAVDDRANVFIDGFLLTNIDPNVDPSSGYRSTTVATVRLSSGFHTFAVKVINDLGDVDPGFGEGSTVAGNPTGFILTAWQTDAAGQLIQRLFGTADYADWLILEYPDTAPGMTIGDVVQTLIEEANTDSILTELASWDFGPITDSAGNDWDQLESVTVNDGDSLLDSVRAFAGAYCDWSMAADSVNMHMWRFGERGSSAGVTYDSTNLSWLEYDTIDDGSDVLLVNWSGGQLRYPATGGTRMNSLQIENATRSEAVTLATQQLDLFGGTRVQISASIEPGAGVIPYTDFQVGDTGITLPGETSGTTSQRCVQIDQRTDDIGVPSWMPKFGDIHLVAQARQQLAVKRMAQSSNGSLGGYSTVASPAGPAPKFGTKLNTNETIFNPSDPVSAGSSPLYIPSANANLYAMAVSATTAGSTDTTFELNVDGTDVIVGFGVLPASSTFVLIPMVTSSIYVSYWLRSNLTTVAVNITAVGTGVAGLVFSLRTV